MAAAPDPFLWDVDEVVRALCAPDSPWTTDRDALSQIVREEEIDGKTLLTFEKTCSRQELMDCLGIKRARHKASLAEKLVNLRAKSRAYRSWYADFDKKTRLEFDGLDTTEVISTNISDDCAQHIPQIDSQEISTGHLGDSLLAETNRSSDSKRKCPDQSVDGGHEHPGPQGPNVLTADEGRLVEGHPPKRKRLRPVNLGVKPVISATSWEDQPTWAYLGNRKLEADAVKSADGLVNTHLVDHADGFATLVPTKIPPGQRMAANRIMKRLLKRNGRKEALLRSGRAPTRSPNPSNEDDEILALSDLPSEWDEDILREIEEEEREREENEKLERFISPDRVQALLTEAIEDIGARWRERKTAKLGHKAHGIWVASRRHGTKNIQVFGARRRVTEYRKRIQTLSARIVGEKWQTEGEVREQARCLEKSVEDELYQRWLMDVIESRVAPPKPNLVPRPPKQPKERSSDPMDEVLTSSDEDDDFVVPDEEDMAMNGDEPTLATPANKELPAFVDLTQSGPRHNEERSTAYVDLTTPTKPPPSVSKERSGLREPDFEDPPPVESLEDVAQIFAMNSSHWAEQNDRWRLTICLLYALSFSRRTRIFEVLKAKTSDEVWETSILLYTETPPPDLAHLETREKETLDFDISRVFYSFSKGRAQTEKHMAPLKERTKKKILKQKVVFTAFCDFVRAVEPLFPQESQIFRTDAFDTELGEEDDEDEEDNTSQGPQSRARRNAAREIVRNRDAVDLRDRVQRRAEDQEARALKLRATLASSGVVSKDKTRLIINESKEDDQSLLYVNEEISKSIKDHQIDGIRFMWNQIIVDPESRQGCLLAHTMGLGKTMQVIAFLVAIAEAAKSTDESLRYQIPHDLRESQTLVLCPAGLVNNWMDELLKWAPLNLLGPLSQLDAQAKGNERISIVKKWTKAGGVLVVGYHMFKQILDADEEAEKMLLEKPSIVVADEAHMLKNHQGKLNRLCSRFSTNSRIALTGSPLANNVEEYYATVNWVAPNFLGPLDEFREVYVRDIEAGLWGDSLAWERRKALKMLQVLKETVASKVNRATIKSSLAGDLPLKSEFVISVAATPIQRSLYELYINGLGSVAGGSKMPQAQVFSIVNDLGLICNHPRCFHQKMLDVRKKPQDHQFFPQAMISAALRETKSTNNMEPSLSLKVQFLIMILDGARLIGDKVLVFSQSIETLDYLNSLFELQKRAVCRLDGKTRIDKRQEKVRDFNIGDQEVYLISTTAGGVGLNIQGANRVVIFDSKWNPVHDQQAVGRAYRLGQKKKVFVYHFKVAGTFEETMQSKAVFKTQLASRVVDKKNPISWGLRLGSLTQPIKDVGEEELGKFSGEDTILDRLIQHPANGQRIKKIVSTDTYEEEDIHTNLTPEEHREAEQLVVMHRLRRTDPEKYERMKEQQASNSSNLARSTAPLPASGLASTRPPQHANTTPSLNNTQANNSLLASQSNGTSTASPVVPANQAGDQASQSGNQTQPQIHSQKDNAFRSTSSAATPFPMAGANTFFGQQVRVGKMAPPPSKGANIPSPMQGGLFSHPQSPEKNDFQRKLVEMASREQHRRLPGLPGLDGRPGDFAASLTTAVQEIRKEKEFGFLLDNQQWRSLKEALDHPRFVLAALSGYLTPTFLALTRKSELLARIDTLNGLSEEDFKAQLEKTNKSSDPENLQNIRRPSVQSGVSPHNTQDLKVMREAADNRRQRPFRLPGWAVENLSGATNGESDADSARRHNSR